jgi:DNA-binding XRE family transcriptional regulator
MNINKLKGKITENGLNVETLANRIGINRASMYRKLGNAEKITIGEARKIKAALNLTAAEATDIFLA